MLPIKGLYAGECDTCGLERTLVKRIVNEQFGNLISPHSNNNIGNFASLDLKEGEVSFLGSFIFNNGSILGFKFKGAVTDGFFPVFSNSKLNSKLGMDVQYNLLDLNKSIIYNNSSCQKYKESKRKIVSDSIIKRYEIENNLKKKLFLIEIDTGKVSRKIDSLKLVLKNTEEGFLKDSIKYEILKNEQAQENNRYKLEHYPDSLDQILELGNWRDKEMEKAMSELIITGYSIGWFSFGYGITINTFNLLDSSLSIDKQISEKTYIAHSLNLQYSFFNKNQSACESFFLSLGSSFSIVDNLSGLEKVEINEHKNLAANPNDRFIFSKYNAYKGDYSKDLLSVSVSGNFYWFLINNMQGAFHIYPEHNMVENAKPVTNLGLGFLIAFKNKEKTEQIINIEPYVNLADIINNRNSQNNIWNRSSYGIRLTFPINFI